VSSPSGKVRVGILFGGRSGEHEISLRSARSVVEAIDRSKYEVSLIGIDKGGRWHLLDEARFRQITDAPLPVLADGASEVVMPPVPAAGELIDPARPSARVERHDVIFPVLHGPYGEDGAIQGLLELADVPYVGAGVLGSAVGMDKDLQKRLLDAAGIPVVPFVTVTRHSWEADPGAVRTQAAALGLPLFVKPANLGSSVGVSKVKTLDTLAAAVATALEYDNKLLIEAGMHAREIECAVLGNEQPEASLPGEICPQGEFYSYAAKYIDETGAVLRIPAPLTAEQIATVRALAVRVFQTLDCAGMARVDFFLEHGSGQFYVNEINTIPGFTSISMYPKLWEASGLAYRDLISRLIDLACERHAQRARLRKTYTPETR
jgi:D-alanine-D-alanine ligase